MSGSRRGGTEITITGHGFSTKLDGNKVVVGDRNCTVQSATKERVKCVVDAEDQIVASIDPKHGNVGLKMTLKKLNSDLI